MAQNIVVEQVTEKNSRDFSQFNGFVENDLWDYEYNRFLPDKSVCSVLRRDKNIVGSQAFIPYMLMYSGKQFLSGRSERTLLDKSIRGGRYFEMIMAHCFDAAKRNGMALIWGFTTATKAFSRIGFRHHYPVFQHTISVVCLSEAIRDIIKEKESRNRYVKIAALSLWPISVLRNVLANTLIKAGRISIESDIRENRDIIRLLEEVIEKDGVCIAQDRDFLKWAYSLNKSEFKKYFAYRENRLVGYFIINVAANEEAQISDFACIDKITFISLWKVIKGDLRKARISFIKTMYNCRNAVLHRHGHYFLSVGFLPFYKGGNMVLYLFSDEQVQAFNDVSKWYLTPVWLQLYKR